MCKRELADCTENLRQTHRHLLSEDCCVILDAEQIAILKEILSRIDDIGEIGFQLEMCVDHDPGHSLIWDNGGTPDQDQAVELLIDELVRVLFYKTPVAGPSRRHP